MKKNLKKVSGGSYSVNENLCVECGICVDSCPIGAITLSDGHSVIDKEKCCDCGTCEAVCPNGAITYDD